MKISEEVLDARGFRLGGTVFPVPTPLHFASGRWRGLFDVDITWPAKGYVTYIHVANGEFMKAGKTEAGKVFETRMNSSYNCLRKVIGGIRDGSLHYVDDSLYHKAHGTDRTPEPYDQDFPWKHRVPLALMALMEGQVIELWAKEQESRDDMRMEECTLNTRYRGEWAHEGWTRKRQRLVPDLRDEVVLDVQCRKKLGVVRQNQIAGPG